MSSVDRYRPVREGYQPPSLPPKPMPAAIDRLSKSPSRRRDVPPAVPSPPAYSSRTSPPRPHSRRSAHSPGQSSPHRAPQPRPNQWFFTADEVASTPSVAEGLPLVEDRLRRAKGVNFIYQAGILLELPQITLWVAGVFFHRFYMRYSMMEEKGGIHHYVGSSAETGSNERTALTNPAEHCGNLPLPCQQDGGKLPENKGSHNCRREGCTKKYQAHY